MITNMGTHAAAESHSCPFVPIRGLKLAEQLHGAGDALWEGMRIVGIIVVLAIVYLVYGRNGDKQTPQSRIADAQREAAAVQPQTAQNPAPAPTSSVRAPIDRTRQVLDLVKQRNAE